MSASISVSEEDRVVLVWALEEAIEGCTANGEDVTGLTGVLQRLRAEGRDQ